MIAVDATVLADFLAGTPELKLPAERLMMEDPDWISTSLWRYELGHVFWKKVRFAADEKSQLRQCLREAELFLAETVEAIDEGAIWDIATDVGLTFYDASYVWLARARGVKLRTRDKQILRDCPDVAEPMAMV